VAILGAGSNDGVDEVLGRPQALGRRQLELVADLTDITQSNPSSDISNWP
jgi:hypothetical protein